MQQEVINLWGEAEALSASPKSALTYEEQQEARREQARQREHRRWEAGNPMLKTAGPGPAGATCKTCCHLLKDHHQSTHYYKCELRGVTRGTATDHRVNWPACAKFSPERPPESVENHSERRGR